MARIRYIKPEFFEDSRIGAISPHARLLFIGLWTLMDRNGLVEATPVMLRSRLFAFDDVRLKDIETWIAELISIGRIRRVTLRGQELLYCPTLSKHQHFHLKERVKYVLTEEELRALDEHGASTSPAPVEHHASTPENGKGDTGRENGKGDTENPDPVLSFDAVWSLYPRKLNKTEAKSRFQRVIKSAEDFDLLARAVKNYAAECKALGTEEKFIKHFSSFLGTEEKQAWRDWINHAVSAPRKPTHLKTVAGAHQRQGDLDNEVSNLFGDVLDGNA